MDFKIKFDRMRVSLNSLAITFAEPLTFLLIFTAVGTLKSVIISFLLKTFSKRVFLKRRKCQLKKFFSEFSIT